MPHRTHNQQDRPPAVETLLSRAEVAPLIATAGRPVVTDCVRAELDDWRKRIRPGDPWPDVPAIITGVKRRVGLYQHRFPRRVVNATGVLIHTNLGRTPWDPQLIEGLAPRLASYISLEYDVEAGARGKRGIGVEMELAVLAGAESALVVNNNAAAVFLVLSSLAWNREAIISRGELVQIGGGFRIPEILARSGAVLREVGTTNRTDPADYANACGPATALILKVHRSNFVQTGFVSEAAAKDLAVLGREKNVPVVWDLGSGAVGPGAVCRYSGEPTLQAAVKSGVDLVTASGDKLLGGPQAGIILGRRDLVRRLRADPFYRALRPGKSTLLALEAAVTAHRSGRAAQMIPLYRMLAVPSAQLKNRAARLAAIAERNGWRATVVPTNDPFGGGAAPGRTVKGWGVRLMVSDSADRVARRARRFHPPIIGTVSDEGFVLSVRTMLPGDDTDVARFLTSRVTGDPLPPQVSAV